MPPTVEAPASDKRVHSKKVLGSHKIFYVEGMCEIWPYRVPNATANKNLLEFLGGQGEPGDLPNGLPKHIKWMRRYLLDFRKIIPAVDSDESGVVESVEKIAPHALNKAWRLGLSPDDASTWKRWLNQLFQSHCDVADKAVKLRTDKKAEADWQSLLESEIFRNPKEYLPLHKYSTL